MVTLLKYKQYLARIRKCERVRLAQPSSCFRPNSNYHISFSRKLSLILFILQHIIQIKASNKLFLTYMMLHAFCISAVETIMIMPCIGVNKARNITFQYIWTSNKCTKLHWGIVLIYWVTFGPCKE